MKNAQLQDPVLKLVLSWKADNKKPDRSQISHLSQDYKTYWAQYERVEVINGILYCKWVTTSNYSEYQYQFVLPIAYRNQVLTMLHIDQLAGVNVTLAGVRDRFYWASYNIFVERWFKRCKECQKRNQPAQHSRGPMKTYIVGEHRERISLDILGSVTKT